jgi:hypothetical protein
MMYLTNIPDVPKKLDGWVMTAPLWFGAIARC